MNLDFIFLQTFLGSTLYQYLLAFGAVASGLAIGKIVSFGIENYLKSIAKKTRNEFDDVVVEGIQGPLWVAFLLAGVWVGVEMLSLGADMRTTAQHVLIGLFILVVAWFFSRIFDSVLKHFVAPLAAKTRSSLDDQMVGLLGKVGRAVIVAIALLVMLSELGVDVTAIVAGLGIGGVAIAFAAQATLSDAFGGLSIFFNKPFKVGDVVSFGTLKGTVSEIGIRYSRLRDFDNRLVTVPNSLIAKENVVNWSSEPSRRVVTNLSLVYGTSAEKIVEAIEIVRQVVRETPNTTGEAIVGFDEYKEYYLNVRAVYYIKETGKGTEFAEPVIGTRNAVNLAIKRAFAKAGIEFAFPTQTVYYSKNAPVEKN